MGRRDAVQVALEVHARMRQILPNLLITYGPDWMTLGNGTSADYEGGLVHHTAAASSLARPFPSATVLHDGRPDLGGPLCNEAVPACTVDAPRLHVVAANPANHAGASGGRSMGPLPTTRLFNPKVRGLEIDYAGSVPMLAGQLLVAYVWSRAVADVVGGGDIERIRAHFETSVTGKWDIGAGAGSVDMAAFRREAATITTTQEDFMATLSDAEKAELLDFVRRGPIYIWSDLNGNPLIAERNGGKAREARGVLGDIYVHTVAMMNTLATLAGRPAADVDEAELARSLAPLLQAQATSLPTADLQQLVKQLADEMDRRARDGDPATGPVS